MIPAFRAFVLHHDVTRVIVTCLVVAPVWVIAANNTAYGAACGPEHALAEDESWRPRCRAPPPVEAIPADVLARWYGSKFEFSGGGRGQAIILGQHNSGTSILTRLMMLLGMFTGGPREIPEHKNPLKYWEHLRVRLAHDSFLQNITDQRFQPFHIQGLADMTGEECGRYKCFVNRTVADLNQHEPWVIKDPRIWFFAHYWLQQMQHPVCVIVVSDPIKTSESLSSHIAKSRNRRERMTTKRWLGVWEHGMATALNSCRSVPTVLISKQSITYDTNATFHWLAERLEAAGVQGLAVASERELQENVLQHIKHRDTSGRKVHGNVTESEKAAAVQLFTALQEAVKEQDDLDAIEVSERVLTRFKHLQRLACQETGFEGHVRILRHS